MDDVAAVWRDPTPVRFLAVIVSAHHEDEQGDLLLDMLAGIAARFVLLRRAVLPRPARSWSTRCSSAAGLH